MNIFNSVKIAKPNRNHFDLSHDFKFSFNMGQLIPILVQDTLPGDSFNVSADALIRFQPLIAPMMHHVDVTTHSFFVPNRLTWPDWDKFITQTDPLAVMPTLNMDDNTYSDLADYMGIPRPIGIPSPVEVVSALPFAAYQMIYNEYYRDQNLMVEIDSQLGSGDNSANTGLYNLRNRAWEHDYFTSALPLPQAGDAISIPLGDVELKNDWSASNPFFDPIGGGGPIAGNVAQTIGATPAIEVNANAEKTAYDPDGSLEIQATTINDLRRATKLQEWFEKAARGGRRLVEFYRSMFGVRSSDARFQRPEYITGTKTSVTISEVVNTAGDAVPQGTMAGHGVSVINGKSGTFYCEEHGYIITIMSVLPRTGYMQGIPKHFIKTDALDFGFPDFAHIGEQAVLSKELFAFSAGGDNTFGYVPRYAEYKYASSRVAGDFRTSLDFWHMVRKFTIAPTLNAAFVTSDPTHRVFAVTNPNEEKLLAHVYNKVHAKRPLPKFGIPTF